MRHRDCTDPNMLRARFRCIHELEAGRDRSLGLSANTFRLNGVDIERKIWLRNNLNIEDSVTKSGLLCIIDNLILGRWFSFEA